MDTAQTTHAPIRIEGTPGRPRRDLTDRELYILGRVASGCTNKTIADELQINPVTVTNTLHRVFEQLNVPPSRLAAVIKALQLGILELPPLPDAGT